MSIRAQLRQYRIRRNAILDQAAEKFSDIIWRVFRTVDRFFSRTDDPGRQQQPRSWLLAPTLLFYFLLFGPCPRWEDASWWRRFFMVLALGGFLAFGLLLDRWKFPKQIGPNGGHRRSRALFFWQFGGVACFFLFSLILVIVQDFQGNVRESDQWTYPHIWHPLALLVFIAGLFAPWIADALLNGVEHRFNKSKIDIRDLLVKADHPEPGKSRLFGQLERAPWHFSAGLVNLISSPLEFLLPAALWVVCSDGSWLTLVISMHFYKWLYQIILVLILVTTGAILVFAETRPRQAAVVDAIKRTFHQGGLWITSLLVIVFALCWLTGFSYVTTLMEGDRWFVVWYLLALYTLFWCYQYWVNRFVSEKILGFFHPADSATQAHELQAVDAKSGDMVSERHGEAQVTLAKVDEAVEYQITIHGSSQFAVSRKGEDLEDNYGVFERSDLMRRLMECLPAALQPEGQILLHELRLKTKAYFHVLNVSMAVLFIWFFALSLNHYNWSWLPWGDRQPIVSASRYEDLDNAHKAQLKSLESLLFEQTTAHEGDSRPHVILIAASGGGTRAALYTSSLLNGLRRLDRLQDVQLVSGVSGGGAAMAYFASHRQRLLAEKPDLDVLQPDANKAWPRFHECMAFAYITDVLRGSCEPRIVLRTSIGRLLAESFDRQFWTDPSEPVSRTMGELPIGLILNTTLAGSAPPDFNYPKDAIFTLSNARYASGLHAGSRLILTNLKDADAFPPVQSKDPICEYLKYQVVQDPSIEVVDAAALNANFPPIFPNEPVDIVSGSRLLGRYWVTDGGAQENRGEISLLFAVRSVLEELKKGNKHFVLPHIHVIVAEASGGSVQYSSDQGISAATGASAELANRFAYELETQIGRLYEELGRTSASEHEFKDDGPAQKPALFRVHYLPMPSIFRIDGGIGTHWMMPNAVILGKTGVAGYLSGQSQSSVVLSKDEAMQIILELHSDQHSLPSHKKTREKILQVWDWIRDDPLTKHHEQWAQLKKALAD
jgi:Patatin-like phospholipase